jgi:diaminopimelate decarboxylase
LRRADSFDRTGAGALTCDGVRLADIASAVGTPAYVYSAATVRKHFRALREAFGDYPTTLHYALKANSTFGIVQLMHELGAAADVNSIWELDLARRAGFDPSAIVFTGVGKSQTELERAVPLGLKAINVESAGELARVEAIADRLGLKVRVAVRINPDIDAQSHPHISTGRSINQFGVPVDEARGLMASIGRRPALKLVAVHVHIGSQITEVEPLERAAALVASLVEELGATGVHVEYVDLGGGLGISYDGHKGPSTIEYAGALLRPIRPTGLPIVIEPGRAIIAPAAVLVARVVDVKARSADSEFAIIDAGMTELLRPALYGAYHRIDVVEPRALPSRVYQIIGPVCESTDVVGRDRALPPLQAGDLVAIRDVGAYGSAMASNYNRRPLPAEVLVDHGEWRCIRRRQTLDDMLALET